VRRIVAYITITTTFAGAQLVYNPLRYHFQPTSEGTTTLQPSSLPFVFSIYDKEGRLKVEIGYLTTILQLQVQELGIRKG
jgi:hypothetical protein